MAGTHLFAPVITAMIRLGSEDAGSGADRVVTISRDRLLVLWMVDTWKSRFTRRSKNPWRVEWVLTVRSRMLRVASIVKLQGGMWCKQTSQKKFWCCHDSQTTWPSR